MGSRLMRIFFCALLMSVLAVASRAGIVLDIPVFAGGNGTAFYEETARQFEALRPGVKINLYGDPRIEDKVRIRIIDGNYPDASNAGYVPWPILIRTGKVLDLKPWQIG